MLVYIKKIDKTYDIDFRSLPKVSQDFIINFGLKTILQNSHNEAKLTDDNYYEEATKAVNRKLEALISGNIHVSKTSGISQIDKLHQAQAYAFIKSQNPRATRKVVDAICQKEGLADVFAFITAKASTKKKAEEKIEELLILAEAELKRQQQVQELSGDFSIDV